MRRDAGFTLIEIVVTLGILGVALFILLDGHYTSLRVQEVMNEEMLARQLLESAVAKAEAELMKGQLNGGEDFGARYPEYMWGFDAARSGEDDLVELYEVHVTVQGPDMDRSLTFFYYDTSLGKIKTKGNLFQKGGVRTETGGNAKR